MPELMSSRRSSNAQDGGARLKSMSHGNEGAKVYTREQEATVLSSCHGSLDAHNRAWRAKCTHRSFPQPSNSTAFPVTWTPSLAVR